MATNILDFALLAFQVARRLVPVVLDIAKLALKLDASVLDARRRYYEKVDARHPPLPPQQLAAEVERLLCHEVLPEVCRSIEAGTPPIEASMPAIIAAGSVLADGLGFVDDQGEKLALWDFPWQFTVT